MLRVHITSVSWVRVQMIAIFPFSLHFYYNYSFKKIPSVYEMTKKQIKNKTKQRCTSIFYLCKSTVYSGLIKCFRAHEVLFFILLCVLPWKSGDLCCILACEWQSLWGCPLNTWSWYYHLLLMSLCTCRNFFPDRCVLIPHNFTRLLMPC